MGVGVSSDATHAQLGRAFQQAVGDQAVRIRDAAQVARHGEHTIMHTLNDLADTSANASLIA